jgi:hypothetical protein
MNVMKINLKGLFFVAAVALVMSCGPGAARGIAGAKEGGNAPSGTGVLWGIVTRGPVVPVQRPGVLSSVPAAGVAIIISRPDGGTAGTAVTDDKGNYRISLPAGTFSVNVHKGPLGRATDLPATVTVTERGETRLDIRLDTGIR